MHRKKLMQACLTGALVVSMGVSNAPVVMAASNDQTVGVEKAADTEDSQESTGENTETSDQETQDTATEGTDQTTTTESTTQEETETTTEKTDQGSTESATETATETADESTEDTDTDAGDKTVEESTEETETTAEATTPETAKKTETTQAAQVPANGQTETQTQKEAEKTVTMNIQFVAGDKVVAGGDYTVPAGVQNYSVLQQYVPAGYEITTTGDFMAAEGEKLTVSIKEISTDVTMNIQFVAGDEVVAGGDYTVPSGVQNYSVLEQYVPEGYKMTASGDFYAEAGGNLVVNIEKITSDVTMNIQFKDGDEVIAGGDYTVPAGVQNYSVLEQYVPEGYQMTTSGDFYAEEGGNLVVNIEKTSTDVTMNIQFKAGDEVIAGGDYTVPAGVQNYSVLEQYVPEGYQMTTSGDFYAEDGGKLVVNIRSEERRVGKESRSRWSP